MKTVSFFDHEIRRRLNLSADVHWRGIYPTLHDHTDFWEFWIVTDGTCDHFVNGNNYAMQKADAILIRPADAHYSVSTEKNFSHVNLAVREDLMKNVLSVVSPTLRDELLGEKELFFRLNPAEFDKTIKYANEFLSGLSNGINPDTTARLFTMFLVETLIIKKSAVTDYPQWITELIAEINKPENLSAFSGEIIKKCNYSRQHALRIFKKYTGKTLSEYINGVKLQNAAEMLLSKKYTVSQVAETLGFDSQSYFCRLFRKTYSVPPSEYK